MKSVIVIAISLCIAAAFVNATSAASPGNITSILNSTPNATLTSTPTSAPTPTPASNVSIPDVIQKIIDRIKELGMKIVAVLKERYIELAEQINTAAGEPLEKLKDKFENEEFLKHVKSVSIEVLEELKSKIG